MRGGGGDKKGEKGAKRGKSPCSPGGGGAGGAGRRSDSSDDDNNPSSPAREHAMKKKQIGKLFLAREDPGINSIREALDSLQAEIDRDGGMTGHWLSQDHETFMRLSTKHKSMDSPAFIEAISSVLQCTHEDVVGHTNWYREYQKRSQLKKELLQKWRVQRHGLLEGQAKDEDNNALLGKRSAEDIRQEEEQRKRMDEIQRVQAENKKKLIADWKDKKILKDAERKRKEKEKDEEIKKKEREHMLDHHRRRGAILKYTEQKRELEQKKKEEKEDMKKFNIPKEDRDRIRMKNEELAKKKTAQMKDSRAKEHALWNKCNGEFNGAPSMKRQFEHVESKLLKKTECYLAKMRKDEDESYDSTKYGVVPGNFADQVGLQRPVRIAPSWRRGL